MKHTLTRKAAYAELLDNAEIYGWFTKNNDFMTYENFECFMDDVEMGCNESDRRGTKEDPFFGYIPDQTRKIWYCALIRHFYNKTQGA
jgi:hypothetical protein